MPDEPDPPQTAAVPAHDDSSAPENSRRTEGQSSEGFRSPLVVGQRWRHYQVGDQIETDTGWCYHAVDVGMLEDIQLRVLARNDQIVMRAQAWRELNSLVMPGLLKGGDAFEEGDYRFEVSQPPPATTLREWAACRQASLDDVQLLVQQLSDVLIAIHDRGVVHLNLRPDTIYIQPGETGLHVALGGLERATIYNQAVLIPVPVDPLYDPPEAAGLAKHSPGAGLRAWDWWSLGRIIQELFLGRHVLSIVVNREISRASPELRARAEALLLERDPRAPRAGAVELMPPMSQRLTDLLRGLLTSSRGGRWGTDEILRWLKQQPVKDRYQLGRNEELFSWKDRMFTVEEAAEYFSREENWTDGITNLFDQDGTTTLASFMADRPEYRQMHERVEELRKFGQIPNWKDLPVAVRQTALASAAWLLLGGEDAKLILYGHRVDAACIKGLFARGGVAEGVALVKALIALPFVQMIEQVDPDAARLLKTLGAAVSGDAVTKALKEGWITLSNAADFGRLVLLTMEPERKLMDLRTSLQERFACSREPHIEQLLKQPRIGLAELVLLASTAAQPERYGYVTHADWNRERYEVLKQRGTRLGMALFWVRLGLATRAGYVVFGDWPFAFGIWFGVGCIAGWPAGFLRLPLWIGAAVAGGATLRFAGGLWFNFLMRRQGMDARPWTFLTDLKRYRREAAEILGVEPSSLNATRISGELAALHNEIHKLALNPAPPPLPQAGWAFSSWAITLAGWSLLLLLLITGYWKPSSGGMTLELDPKAAAALAIESAMKATPADEKLTAEDYFYNDPRNPRTRWNVPRPAEIAPVPALKIKPASSDEVATALIDGQRLLLPYQQNSVDTLIAVPVGGKKGSGLMLYDGKNRRVIQRQVLLPSVLPADRSWFEIDKLKVFYVGAPPPPPPPPVKPVVDPQKPMDMSDLPEREVRRGAYQDKDNKIGAEQKPTNAQPLSEALDTMTP